MILHLAASVTLFSNC